jgi:hypothetical protein
VTSTSTVIASSSSRRRVVAAAEASTRARFDARARCERARAPTIDRRGARASRCGAAAIDGANRRDDDRALMVSCVYCIRHQVMYCACIYTHHYTTAPTAAAPRTDATTIAH